MIPVSKGPSHDTHKGFISVRIGKGGDIKFLQSVLGHRTRP